ncbi:MAG: PAS domain-containing protein [Candidatus Omnitrophota bacterium]
MFGKLKNSKKNIARVNPKNLTGNPEVFRTLLDNLPCFAMVLKKKDRSIICSNALASKAGAILGKTCYETITKRNDPCPFCKAPEMWATNEPKSIEVEYLGAYYEAIWIPLSDENYVHYIFNITERKKTEAQLKEQYKLIKIYQDMVASIIVTLNTEGKITLINKQGCQILGYPEEELIGKLWFSTCLPQTDEIKKVYSVFLKILAGEIKAGEYFVNQILTRSGQLRLVAWHNTLLYDEHNRIIGIFSSGEDITERKQAEEKIMKFEEVVKHSDELINLATLDGQMIFINIAGAKMLGISCAEVNKFKIMDVIPGPYQDLVKNELLVKLKQGETWNGELQYRNLKTNSSIDVYAMCFTIKDAASNLPLYFVNISRDITEKKLMEEGLRKRLEELEVFYQASIGREQRIIELKEEVESLKVKLGE